MATSQRSHALRSNGPNGVVVDSPCDLEQVHAPSRTITFLDYKLTIDPKKGLIRTSVHDKRRDMPCYANSRTFPHRKSVLPWTCKVGVITSQFTRFVRRECTMDGFLQETSSLVANMILHGYPPDKVEAKVEAFRRKWESSGANALGRPRQFFNAFPSWVNATLAERRS